MRFPTVFAGISPKRPTPGKRSSVTLFDSQVTPDHTQGVGCERFQRIMRPPTAARKASSPALSEDRSVTVDGRGDRQNKMVSDSRQGLTISANEDKQVKNLV